MSTLTVRSPRRLAAGGSLAPEDFADIAPCESVSWGEDGSLVLVFSRDLTAAERVAARIRCEATSAAEETLMRAAAQALHDNAAFLDLVTVTNADAVKQLRALTRQVNGLMRLTLKHFD